MSTISVPLSPKLEKGLNDLIKSGYGASKADVMRQAIARLLEDEAVFAVLRAEQDVKEGRVVTGDLREIMKNMNKK